MQSGAAKNLKHSKLANMTLKHQGKLIRLGFRALKVSLMAHLVKDLSAVLESVSLPVNLKIPNDVHVSLHCSGLDPTTMSLIQIKISPFESISSKNGSKTYSCGSWESSLY